MPASMRSGQFRPQPSYHVDTEINGMGNPHPEYHSPAKKVRPHMKSTSTSVGAATAWESTPGAPLSANTLGSNLNFDPPKAPTEFTKTS